MQRMKPAKGINVNSDSLPLDLIMEILKRLPVKTLMRFLSLSKPWASIIRSRDFNKLFLNVSLTRPRGLLFRFRHQYHGVMFPSVHPKNTREPSPLTTYHVSRLTGQHTPVTPSVHGFICYGLATRPMLFNPCARRSIALPEIDTWRRPISYYIGHDPIDNVYKVLAIITGWSSKHILRLGIVEEIRVLTLGTGNSWKTVQDNITPHSPSSKELCINGVLYYKAFTGTNLNDPAIMSFDVRSEKFRLIKGGGPCSSRNSSRLTSYEGKLAVIILRTSNFSGVIALWVLEDAAKEEWSNKTFVLPTTKPPLRSFQRFCTTDKGELILAPTSLPASLLSVVLYIDLKNKSVRRLYLYDYINN